MFHKIIIFENTINFWIWIHVLFLRSLLHIVYNHFHNAKLKNLHKVLQKLHKTCTVWVNKLHILLIVGEKLSLTVHTMLHRVYFPHIVKKSLSHVKAIFYTTWKRIYTLRKKKSYTLWSNSFQKSCYTLCGFFKKHYCTCPTCMQLFKDTLRVHFE